MGNDEISEEEIIRRIFCSVSTFFCSNCCWAFLSVIVLLIGLLGLVLAGSEMAIFPFEAYISAVAFSGYTLLIIGMGCLGTCARVELCFILYIFFASIGFVAHVVGLTFLLLYSLDVAGYSDASSPVVEGTSFLQNHLESILNDDLNVWVDVQDNLDCCGIDFEFGFELSNNIELLEVESGDVCNDTRVELAILRASIVDPTLDDEDNIIEAIDDPIFGIDTEYFCMSKVSAIISESLPGVIFMIVLIMIVQLSALVSAGRMYWVPEFLGGWALDQEAMDDIAEHKGIKFTAPEGGYSGGRVLSTIRNAGARVSYRLQNAVTADPRVEPGAGFMKRLSTNRAVSFVGAAPSNPRQEDEEENENQGGRTNSVRSMLSIISKGFGRAPKSLIDTNAMGIASPPGLGVPKAAQAAAASTRHEEVNTQSKLLTSFAEDEGPSDRENVDSLNI